jgi:hypothetical protein
LNDSVAYTQLKTAANKFKIERRGWFLDFAGGFAWDFPHDTYDSGALNKAGAWLTGGYENDSTNGWSILGIARYLYQPNTIFADTTGKVSSKNVSTFDGGARLIYSVNNKFSASCEGLYRSVLNKNATINPSWRVVFNFSYDVGFNQKMTLSLGKDFDNTLVKQGNLISALNFIAGFGGNTKKISN